MTDDFYKRLVDCLHDGVYFVDTDRTITYWNRGAERITGYSPGEVLGRRCADNLLQPATENGEILCLSMCPLAKTLQDGVPRQAEVSLLHKQGHRVAVSVHISPVRDENGRIIGAAEIFSGIEGQRDILGELFALKRLSLADPLTGLGNRRAAQLEFDRRMKALLHRGEPLGLLFADIDHFKDVNDTYGHETGDRVLVHVARTIGSALRAQDFLCRWGGEEFVALLPGVDGSTFQSIAERMRRLVQESELSLTGTSLRITISVGGSQAAQDDTLDSLAERADAMLYQAKRAGRNCAFLDCS